MFLWQPPPPVKIQKAVMPGYHVKIVGRVGAQECQRYFESPNNERHFASLTAARLYAHSMIQEILSRSEEIAVIEFDAQIWLIGSDGEETLHDAIILCAERYLALSGKPAKKA